MPIASANLFQKSMHSGHFTAKVSVIRTLLLLLMASCSQNPTGPASSQRFGVSGKVYTTDGSPLTGAKIFCIYYLNSVPVDPPTQFSLARLRSVKNYSFELHQSFPNPCAHSFFVRFSLPEQCLADFSITSMKTKTIVYHYSDTLSNGFYQRYYGGIVDSLGLENGIYGFQLSAKGVSDSVYDAEISFLVVSNSQDPNAVSGADGSYFFDYRDSFIGDSVAVSTDGTVSSYEHIQSPVNLIVSKSGYVSKRVTVDLLPNAILTTDIVLDPVQ